MSLPTRNEIATLAATLICDGKSPADACRLAVRILDVAEFAAAEIKARGYCLEGGIDRWEQREEAIGQRKMLEAKRPPRFRENEVLAWREFETELFPPKPASERLPRFKRWLQFMENIDNITAGQRVAEFRKNGVPASVWSWYFTTFHNWWARTVREQNSTSGKKGQAAKKKNSKKVL